MRVVTITGQSLDDYFKNRIPQGLINPLIRKLELLQNHGRDCIGAFVFPHKDAYQFTIDEPKMSEAANVYITFIDLHSLIIILDVYTYQKSF